jgi:hypothetical protein
LEVARARTELAGAGNGAAAAERYSDFGLTALFALRQSITLSIPLSNAAIATRS